jgi:hypothetical protein
MRITLIRKITGKELIKDFENTYGSLKRLEKLHERNPNNMKIYTDLDDWRYYLEHPREEIEDGKTIITDRLTLGKIEMELLNFIKHQHPQSIRELARMIHKDVRAVQPRVNKLAEEGLIEFKPGPKNSKIPQLNYDKIEIEV